jgi:hypothetical protein
VRHDASFAEVLDSHLGCTEVPSPTRVWSSRPLTSPLFAFERPLPASRPVSAATAAPVAVEAPLPAALTSLERQTLDDAPTLDALRRAYRTLARRYHPDCHEGRGPVERDRLARLFAEATGHYRRLTRRFAPVQ